MTDYVIIAESTFAELVAKVKAKMADGWEPTGGVSFSPHVSEPGIATQAMVKRDI